jgi:hypothetical protein
VRALVGGLNILLGEVYTSYGVLTIIDLKREWRRRGFSHFGIAWIAMAFTCGPHHLEHGLHVAFAGRAGGALDLFAVLVGLPAGVAWFLLRIEALLGGRGDRFLPGTPRWVAALPALAAVTIAIDVAGAGFVLRHGGDFGPRLVPNVLLLGLYGVIGYYLLRTQLANHRSLGGWSLSGLSLSVVFPTCGLMHAFSVVYASSGRYDVDVHGLTIDWLAVPGAVYFLWVVRALHHGAFSDWNGGATGVRREEIEVAA